MPIVLRLQSLVESQLQGFGSPELVSILAELFVAACLFGPVVALFAIASWLLKRSGHTSSGVMRRRPTR